MNCLTIAVIIVVVFIGTIIFLKYCKHEGIHFQGGDMAKELSTKEKAKAYDEAKARMMREFNSGRCSVFLMNEIFPELKSEDERIRYVLIDYFNRYKEQEECGIKTFYGIPTDNILVWLELQRVFHKSKNT